MRGLDSLNSRRPIAIPLQDITRAPGQARCSDQLRGGRTQRLFLEQVAQKPATRSTSASARRNASSRPALPSYQERVALPGCRQRILK